MENHKNTLHIDIKEETKKRVLSKNSNPVQKTSKMQQKLINISKKLGLSHAIYQR